jgi:hypothetical protein
MPDRKVLDQWPDGLFELPGRKVRCINRHGDLHWLQRRILLEHNRRSFLCRRMSSVLGREDLRNRVDILFGLS